MPKSKSRKKKKSGRSFQQQKFSPISYIKSKGRSLPVSKVYISDGWEELGALCAILVIKEQPSGKFAIAYFLLDTGCLGVKNTDCNCNLPETQVEEITEKVYEGFEGNYKEVEWDLANELIWGAIDYAAQFGFKPNKSFKNSQYLLMAQKDLKDEYELEFGGDDGKPLFISGPFDDVHGIITKLTAKVGKDGFNIVDMTGQIPSELIEDED